MVTEKIESIVEACQEVQLAGDQILVVRECRVAGIVLDHPQEQLIQMVAKEFQNSPERIVKLSETIKPEIAKNIVVGNFIIRDGNVSPILVKNPFDNFEVDGVAESVREVSKLKDSKSPINLKMTKFTIRLYSIVHAAYCVGSITPHESQIKKVQSSIIQ